MSGESEYDISNGIEAIETLADQVPSHPEGTDWLNPEGPIVAAAVGMLRDAREWAELRKLPLEDFAGDDILRAAATKEPIAIGAFVAALRTSAIQLLQMRAFAGVRS